MDDLALINKLEIIRQVINEFHDAVIAAKESCEKAEAELARLTEEIRGGLK